MKINKIADQYILDISREINGLVESAIKNTIYIMAQKLRPELNPDAVIRDYGKELIQLFGIPNTSQSSQLCEHCAAKTNVQMGVS